LIVVAVHREPGPNLLEIVNTLGSLGAFFGASERWQKQTNKNRYNGDDDQQFY
jgi:hypothetical protein